MNSEKFSNISNIGPSEIDNEIEYIDINENCNNSTMPNAIPSLESLLNKIKNYQNYGNGTKLKKRVVTKNELRRVSL